MNEPTRKLAAMRNAATRALRHIERGHPDKAVTALHRGLATARRESSSASRRLPRRT